MKQDALQMIQGWKLPIWNAAKKEEGMQKARLLMQTDLFDLKGNFGCFYGKAGSNSVTIPDPIVRPPSRMVKRWPTSMATAVISFTYIVVVSPGVIISVPLGSVIVPVISVVRK